MNPMYDGATHGQVPAPGMLPVLEATLCQLREYYNKRQISPGKVERIYIRQGWIAVTGTHQECGIAPYDGGMQDFIPDASTPTLRHLQSLVGMPLFVLPDLKLGIRGPLESSVKLAALSALSQPFLGCPTIRRQGWHAECWRADDHFVQENPVLAHMIRPDDIVAVAGSPTGCWRLREICREFHIVTTVPVERSDTLCIGGTLPVGPARIRFHPAREAKGILENADIVLLPPSTLVNGTFDEYLGYAKNARLKGLIGPGASLIPGAFFSRGIDFIQSCRIIDTLRFEDEFINDPDPTTAFRSFQKQYLVVRQDCPQYQNPGTRRAEIPAKRIDPNFRE